MLRAAAGNRKWLGHIAKLSCRNDNRYLNRYCCVSQIELNISIVDLKGWAQCVGLHSRNANYIKLEYREVSTRYDNKPFVLILSKQERRNIF